MWQYLVAVSFKGSKMSHLMQVSSEEGIGIEVAVYCHDVVALVVEVAVISQFCLSFWGDDKFKTMFLPQGVAIGDSGRREVLLENAESVHFKIKSPTLR